MIYVLKHPNKGFSGHAGVDFHNGIGSTSSIQDAKMIAKKIGAELVPYDDWAVKASEKAGVNPSPPAVGDEGQPAKGGKKKG